jgi:hypothetical protein
LQRTDQLFVSSFLPYFSALTYYEHMLIMVPNENNHAETEVLPTYRRHARENMFPTGGSVVFREDASDPRRIGVAAAGRFRVLRQGHPVLYREALYRRDPGRRPGQRDDGHVRGHDEDRAEDRKRGDPGCSLSGSRVPWGNRFRDGARGPDQREKDHGRP